MPRIIAFVLVLMASSSLSAKSVVDFNERMLEAQDHLYHLRLKKASELIDKEANTNPDNLCIDYLSVIEKLLFVLTNESPSTFSNYHKQVHTAIKNISGSDLKGPYPDFFLEEIHFYTSVVHGKSGNALAAANAVRQSYKHGERVRKNHPEFTPALKTLGLIHAGFGNLPNGYRKLVSMLGYTGTTDKGIAELKQFIDGETKPEWEWMKQESRLFLAAIELYLKNDEGAAWKLAEGITKDYKTNPLMVFVRANFAEKCKKNDVLISTLLACPKSEEYERVYYFDFALGVAKLQRLDPDAYVYLRRYLHSYKGSNYVKSCYQKLAWHQLIHGNKSSYDDLMQELLTKGEEHLEEDQQAELEATRNIAPDKRLLKARLLFDGGYYQRALSEIKDLKAESFATTLLKTEYCYRKARIYDKLNEDLLAEAFYKAAILTGKNLSVYYASYSALYLAELHEANGKKNEAREYFKKATSFKENEEYKNSIEHRAKAGLHRVSK